MKLLTTLQLAVSSLLNKKVRTALTVVGIVIGIATVMLVVSVGDGVKALIFDQIAAFGSDTVFVEVKLPNTSKYSTSSHSAQVMGVELTTLKLDDALAVSRLPGVKNYYAAAMDQEAVSYRGNLKKTILWASTSEYVNIDRAKVEYGRFFSEEEDRSLAKVAVLGSKAKDKLFGDQDPIGEFIKIRGQNWRVIGVMGQNGMAGFMDLDGMIYTPLRSTQEFLLGYNYIPYFAAQIREGYYAESVAEDIRYLLRKHHNLDYNNPNEDKDDFSVTTMEETMGLMNTIMGGITLLLIAIAVISLIVGGVGIMNIMYVTVTERTREIGLRKAVGAKGHDILIQFLFEAIIITLIGGIIGIISGAVFSFLISLIAQSQGVNLPFIVSWQAILLGVAMAKISGLVFGVYPARKAAALDPIKALRFE